MELHPQQSQHCTNPRSSKHEQQSPFAHMCFQCTRNMLLACKQWSGIRALLPPPSTLLRLVILITAPSGKAGRQRGLSRLFLEGSKRLLHAFFFPGLTEMARQSTLILEFVHRSCSNDGFEVMGEALLQISAQVPSHYPA